MPARAPLVRAFLGTAQPYSVYPRCARRTASDLPLWLLDQRAPRRRRAAETGRARSGPLAETRSEAPTVSTRHRRRPRRPVRRPEGRARAQGLRREQRALGRLAARAAVADANWHPGENKPAGGRMTRAGRICFRSCQSAYGARKWQRRPGTGFVEAMQAPIGTWAASGPAATFQLATSQPPPIRRIRPQREALMLPPRTTARTTECSAGIESGRCRT